MSIAQTASLSDVPSYQKLMLPLLQFASDGGTHTVLEAMAPIGQQIGLSDSGMEATLPDGRNKLRHRLEWARTYLKKAGVFTYPRRGAFTITTRGHDLLQKNPKEITRDLLLQYPEFVEFVDPSRVNAHEQELLIGEVDPEEAIENSHLALRKSVEAELLDRVKNSPPEFLEQLVIDLLLKMGYGGSRKEAGKAIGRTGDGGIDGIINEDPLGLDVVYVQAKRWATGTVGRPDVQQFVGALNEKRARKGVFITTSQFSRDAITSAGNVDQRIVLIDGRRLATLMFDHDIGVTRGKEYVAKKVDADYFSEEQ